MKSLSQALQQLCLDDGAELPAQINQGVAEIVGEMEGTAATRKVLIQTVTTKANEMLHRIDKTGKYLASALLDALMSEARSKMGELSTRGALRREGDGDVHVPSPYHGHSVFPTGIRRDRRG